MTKGFGDMFSEANAGTDALVRSGTEVGEADFAERGLIDRSLVDEVASLDGVAAAEPRIEGGARIVGADGDPLGGNGPPTQGGNWIADDALNPYDLAEGRAPRRTARSSSTRRQPSRATWRWGTPPRCAPPSRSR